MISFGDVQIKPFENETILYMSVKEKINEHTTMTFRLLVSEEKKDTYINTINSQEKISLFVKKLDGQEETLFWGKLQNLKVENQGGVYELLGEAISYTKDFDIKLKSRSFQNKELTYDKLMENIISKYEKAHFNNEIIKNKKTGKFIIQYRETDWEFMKRMVSHFNAALIPICTKDSPLFYIGTYHDSKEEELLNINYVMSKNIEEFKDLKENYIKDFEEIDNITYSVESNKFLALGSKVKFKDKTYFVKSGEIVLKDGLLLGKYELVSEKGMKVPKIYNQDFIGASIMGKVLEIKKDMLKLHLEIDEKQDKGKAWSFKHTTNYTGKGSTGWYCMPEIGDYVRLHFPSNKEDEAVVIDSIRHSSEKEAKTSNPDVTYFRTAAGREVMFSPGGILISGHDGKVYINLSSKEGISIVSDSTINITSGENITISAEKNLLITAKEKIDISCKESTFKMDGNIDMKGNNIKAN